MAYSKFTLDKVMQQFDVSVTDDTELFSKVENIPPSIFLQALLEKPTSFNIESEKARSEKIIAPIIDDIFTTVPNKFAIFSGENFDVDKHQSLNGLADYIICVSKSKAIIQSPVAAIAESKRNDPKDGMGQCIAELIASAIFNEQRKSQVPKLFGIMTNGNQWLMGIYIIAEKHFIYDPTLYSIRELPRIIGILSFMRDEALRMYDKKQLN